MKKRIIMYILACVGMLTCFLGNASEVRLTYGDFSNRSSEIVMEVNSLRVLSENNSNEKKYMASTTKILTAIVVIENCNLDDKVTVTSQSVGVEGSSVYLEAGEILTVKELLYGLMLRSGNDCAETLALYCSKSIKDFAELMNTTAKRIGAVNSNFVNPHGLHNDNHYTTAYDLAIISCYAMKNESFREIVSTRSVDISWSTKEYKRHLINKNKMLREFEGSTGIKTGYTKKAGRCLVSSCVRNGMELVCVVLNCAPMFERSKTLLSQCFENYSNCLLVKSDNIVDFLDMENSDKKCAVYIKNDVVLPLRKNEEKNIKICYEFTRKVRVPVKKDSEIGIIKIICQNNLLFTEKVYTMLDID